MAKTKKIITKSDSLTLVKDRVLDQKQILHVMQRTPADHVYTRPARGGGTWDYVTGIYVKKVLNYAFGWDWDFTIKNHGVEGDCIWVMGRLAVRANGKEIVREQFGRADVKKRKDGTGYLDFGNDLKAATTDALKKCASELGIASDVYGKNEFKEIKIAEVKELPKPVRTPSGVVTPPQTPIKNADPVVEVTEDNLVEMRKGLE